MSRRVALVLVLLVSGGCGSGGSNAPAQAGDSESATTAIVAEDGDQSSPEDAIDMEMAVAQCEERLPDLADVTLAGGLVPVREGSIASGNVSDHLFELEGQWARCHRSHVYRAVDGREIEISYAFNLYYLRGFPSASELNQNYEELVAKRTVGAYSITELAADSFSVDYTIDGGAEAATVFSSDRYIGSQDEAGLLHVVVQATSYDPEIAVSLSDLADRLDAGLPARRIVVPADLGVSELAGGSGESDEEVSAHAGQEITEDQVDSFCESSELKQYVQDLYDQYDLSMVDGATIRKQDELMRVSGNISCRIPPGYSPGSDPLTEEGQYLRVSVIATFVNGGPISEEEIFEGNRRNSTDYSVETGPDGLHWEEGRSSDVIYANHWSLTDFTQLGVSVRYTHHDGPRLPLDFSDLHDMASDVFALLPGTVLVE